MITNKTDVLGLYSNMAFLHKLHLRVRLLNCPFDKILQVIPQTGIIGDVGCGHGLLSVLASGVQTRCLIGVDPDSEKIKVAKRCLKDLKNIDLRVGFIGDLPDGLDAVVVCDVLYLIPFKGWRDFIKTLHNKLKPDGKLIIKEAGTEPTWKYWKTTMQEYLTVKLLSRTFSSQPRFFFRPTKETEQLLKSSGFRVDKISRIDKGYSTPHVLFVATKVA